MLTYIDASGNLVKTVPEKIYQGSNLANTIYLVGAYPQASVVTIAFKLPQTGHYTEPYIMLNANIPTEIGLNAWSFDLPVAITEYYGKVEFQVTIYGGTKTLIIDGVETPVPVQIKSAYGTFEVEKGVQVDASQIQAPDVYDQILQLISQIQAQINDHSLIAMGILPYSSDFEYPLNALTYYDGNLYRSLQAENVGKDLDDTEYWEEWDLNEITDLLARVGALETTVSGLDGRITQAQTDATSALTKVGRIKVVDNQNGSFTFTNGENQDTTIECSGSNPDNETIVLNASNELEAVAIKDSTSTITPSDVRSNTSAISTINSKIPAQASSSNQLADKEFVNSSIASNTANFIGTFASVSDLEAYSGTVTDNDYAFVINSVVTDNGDDWATFAGLDAYDKTLLTNFDYAWVVNGSNFDLYRFDIVEQEWVLRVENTAKDQVTLNTAYNRYKATVSGLTVTWTYEYTLNNSSFTAAQWAAINSGATAQIIASIADKANDNAVVHLAGAETITGEKTFSTSPVVKQISFVNNTSSPSGNILYILNDNGYNAKIRFGSHGIMFTSGGSIISPDGDESGDLGSSSYRWKDLYLSSSARIDNYIIDKDAFGQLQIRNANTTSMQFDGSTVRSQNIVPMANNQKDLGSSSMKWKDLYLSGNLSDGTNSISVAQILTSGAFKSLNLTSTTLSADELSTIQNYNVVLQSDITLGSGTTLHAQTILTKPFSYSNTLRGLYIDNSKVGTYLIDTNTNTLGQGAQDIVLNGVAQINSKAIPSYPNDNNTYYLEFVNGTLTWVQDNTVKVNTTSYSTKRVYGQNAVGAEQMIQVSPNAYGQFLVERDSNGMFNVNEPTLSTHPASKNYVDTTIASAITTALNTPV